MKIIINKTINKLASKLVVIKNDRQVENFRKDKDDDFCELKCNEGDSIVIRLKSFCSLSAPVAKYICHDDNDIVYVGPTHICKIWEMVNFKILPYFTLFFVVLEFSFKSISYSWFCAVMVVLTALSLIVMQLGMHFPFMTNRLYRSYKL